MLQHVNTGAKFQEIQHEHRNFALFNIEAEKIEFEVGRSNFKVCNRNGNFLNYEYLSLRTHVPNFP